MIYSLAIDKHDNKWIGTTKGLAMLSGSKWTSYHTLNSKLPHNHVTALAIDRDDNKWIGTFEGLAKLSRNNWQIFKRNNSPLPYDDIYSLNANNSGKILISTWGGGLAVLDKLRWVIYKTDNSALPDNYVSSCLIDQAKNFWVATLGGLAKYDGTKWVVLKTSNSKLPDDMVYSLIQDQKGNLWIGTENGLAVFNETGIPNHVSKVEELSAKIKNEKVVNNNQIIPSNYSLENIYYDSVNSKIKIHFSIPKRSNILLKIEDTLGRINKVLKNEILEAGNYESELSAEEFPSGVYFCHLSAGELKVTRKIQLVN
jgi:ligand-binding sensor domain-containing protein